MRTKRVRWLLVVALFLAALSVAACGSDAEKASPEASTTESSAPIAETEATTTSSGLSNETSTTTEPSDELDLSDSLWLVNGYDGLVDDRGRQLGQLEGEVIGGARTTARAADGTLYLTAGQNLWSLAPGDVDLAAFDLDLDSDDDAGDPAALGGLGYGADGQVVTGLYADEPLVLDDRGGRRFQFEVTDDGSTQSITAANGLTVRVIEPTGEYDSEAGYLSKLETPAKLEVLDINGEVAWTIEAGGSSAVWLSLVDFNGRHVMFARAPSEPADPLLQHIVYDLDCPYGNNVPPEGAACTRTFWTQFGKATLVGSDLPAGEANLNPQLLDICPTALSDVQPPLEMTEDWFGPAVFTDVDREAFEDLALALKTCDPLGVLLTGDHVIAGVDSYPGLDYEAGAAQADGANSGWMWTELARALDGPFDVLSDANTKAVWQRYDGAVAIRLEQPDGYMTIDPPSSRPPGNVAVVRTDDHVVVSGDIGQGSVPVILAAVNDLADEAELEVVDYLIGTSAADDDDPVSDFTAAIGRELGEAGREVHLAYGEVLVSPSAEGYGPELTEIAFAFSDFADGGDGTFDELPLADEVALALGPEVVARRGRDDLVERNAWTVNDSDFRAYSGPFDILSQAGGPVVVGSGVHPHCASPLPTPAPPELAQFQRVWLQPPEDSIDSCLNWSSVDLFVDDTGRIRGVSLDLWEP